jgi:hypothetical protein
MHTGAAHAARPEGGAVNQVAAATVDGLLAGSFICCFAAG